MHNQSYLDEYKYIFIKDSIQDIQNTIRATDVKSGFFLAILCLPITNFDKIKPYFIELCSSNIFVNILVILTIIFWFLSSVLLIYSLVPLSNPKDSINFDGICSHPKGFYFGGYHKLKLGFWHSLIPYSTPKEKYNILEDVRFIKSMDLDKYYLELHFERIKLIHIRNVKVSRLQNSNICMLISFFLLVLSTIIFYN